MKANLTVEEATCTEVWLGLATDNTDYTDKDTLHLTLHLYRNDRLVAVEPFTGGDTLLYDAGLQPAADYAYWAELVTDSLRVGLSDTVTVTTMDTTSHEFEWQSWEFGGQGGSSIFHDVAIIDENDIWAVGEIYTADDKYNAAHWDGQKWELERILFYYQGNYYWGTLFAVFAFNKNDVWLGTGSLMRWNGSEIQSYKVPDDVFPSTINKMWGTSSSDLYIVGNSGLIAHYNGKEWRRIESGTELDLEDVTGKGDTVLICGYDRLGNSVLIRVNKNTSEILYTSHSYYADPTKGEYGRFSCVFYHYPVWYVWSTAGLMRFWENFNRFFLITAETIGAQEDRIVDLALNNNHDILLVDAWGYFIHYNGTSWKSDTCFVDTFGPANFFPKSADFKGDIAVIVGYHYSTGSAVIVLGKRE